MTRTELMSLTIVELKALAKKKKVLLPTGATKASIVKILAAKIPGVGAKLRTVKAKTAIPVAAKGKKKASAKPARKKAAKKAAVPKIAKAARRPAVKKTEKSAAPVREWRMSAPEESLAAQERVEGAKYYTGPSVLRPSVSGSLPRGYGEERLVLLVRDPHTAFAYWEIAQGRLDQERARAGNEARLVVRIYDVTGIEFDGNNATAFFDQEVYERIGSWYFDLGRAGRTFCADLGLRSPDGRFRTLVRSNAASMPRETFSDVLDAEWMSDEEEFLRLYGLSGRGLSSAHLQELVQKRRLLEISSPGMFGRKGAGPRRG